MQTLRAIYSIKVLDSDYGNAELLFFLSKTFQNLQNSNEFENRYGVHWKMLQSVNNDGSPKHDKCMASHARKIWALPTKYCHEK